MNKTMSRWTLWAGACTFALLSVPAMAAEGVTVGKGQHFYDQTCSKCHDTGVGPNIKGRGLPEAYYIYVVRHGRNAMPAFRVTDIDDATLKDLAAYLANTPVKK